MTASGPIGLGQVFTFSAPFSVRCTFPDRQDVSDLFRRVGGGGARLRHRRLPHQLDRLEALGQDQGQGGVPIKGRDLASIK